MSQQLIPCTMDSNNILSPTVPGLGIANATIDYQQTEVGGRTATISFGGIPQAFVTLDQTTGRVIGYTLTTQSEEARASIENIIANM
ncbi:hypothetical protein F9Z84_06725 [Escherichia coli]|nr:hypothetical protein F9Z84_06725 [Escherichia coli]